jgi:hypothetical protein
MDQPSYSDDSNATRFLTGRTVFPGDTRIFHRPDFQYDEAAVLSNARFDGRRLSLTLTHWSSAPGMLEISPVSENILRISMGRPDDVFMEQSPMLLTFTEDRHDASFEETTGCYV